MNLSFISYSTHTCLSCPMSFCLSLCVCTVANFINATLYEVWQKLVLRLSEFSCHDSLFIIFPQQVIRVKKGVV